MTVVGQSTDSGGDTQFRPLSEVEQTTISGGWRLASGLPDLNGLVMGVRILA